ncbi:MAG: FCD domain-containing protein [Anaerolineae bacterium]|nr:FCD domain-containing protein [Anaerolineae bacterium]
MVLPIIPRLPSKLLFSEFLEYLVSPECVQEEDEQLPPMNELSKQLEISQGKLREQLEVAKSLGLVDVNPRKGIRRLPYSFLPAVRQSLMIALALDCWTNFAAFTDLRNQVEAGFWHPAVRQLTPDDHHKLRALISCAWEKLRRQPIEIPHLEHRELHLTIYHRLDNPFVLGILEAYWQAYETVGLNLFTDYAYLDQVWQYHDHMVAAICTGDYDSGYDLLVAHKDLLAHRQILRPQPDN